jgi:hypothetical protein
MIKNKHNQHKERKKKKQNENHKIVTALRVSTDRERSAAATQGANIVRQERDQSEFWE